MGEVGQLRQVREVREIREVRQRRAGLRYALKVHGSDLSYTVLPELDRFHPYAEEAVAGAAGILVGSSHIAARLRLAVDDPETNAKVRLGPPGVDVDRFSPIPRSERPVALESLAQALRATAPEPAPSPEAGSSWDRDAQAAAEAIDWYAEARGPRVIFVGKLIVSKGIDLLLAAWPLVHARHPDARLLVVGFGAAERTLREVEAGLAAGDLGPLRGLAAAGRGLEGGEAKRLRFLSAFLDRAPADYAELARAAAGSVHFAGRLEHGEVATPVACSEALVFPSTFPEAFGMVAAEAAAAGALPVSAAHSGAAEVSSALAADLPERISGLVSFDLDEDAVTAIAARIDAWLMLEPGERETVGAALRATVDRLWSWAGSGRRRPRCRRRAPQPAAAAGGGLRRMRLARERAYSPASPRSIESASPPCVTRTASRRTWSSATRTSWTSSA